LSAQMLAHAPSPVRGIGSYVSRGRHGVPTVKHVSSALAGIRQPMDTPKSFPHAGFLSQLESLGASVCIDDARMPLSVPLTRVLMLGDEKTGQPAPATASLIHLLQARQAVWQASFDAGVVADELRRYQKFARPGQPSAQIVRLRQQQAAARQAGSQARQAFIRAAVAFVRDADIPVPPRMALEVFITDWIDANVPKACAPATK
jgi:hypothetical protein